MNIEWYGWKRDLPDFRDWRYTRGVTGKRVGPLPPKVDLRASGFLPPVYDQGPLGSCTAQALCTLFFYVNKQDTGLSLLTSRLFLYYEERKEEGTVWSDSGAMIRTGIKVMVSTGNCNEYLWPYKIDRFSENPDPICYKSASKHQSTAYRSVSQNMDDLRSCLAEGFPYVGGIAIYDSFESDAVARTGMVPMPGINERLLGGHAVTFVGYDDASRRFIVQNSWGDDWGDKGFFYLPYDYCTNLDLADDFWMIHNVEIPTDDPVPEPPEPFGPIP